MAKPKLALIPCTQGYFYSSVLPSDGSGDFRGGRSGKATRINSQGLIEEVDSEVSRLNYPMIDGKVVGCPHHILEPQRTNLLTHSEGFVTDWNNTNITINSNSIISPDGSLNGTKFIPNNTSGSHYIDRNLIVVNSNASASIFAKKGEYQRFAINSYFTGANAVFDLSTGSVVSSSSVTSKIEDYGNGWYRCSLNETLNVNYGYGIFVMQNDSLNKTASYAGNGTDGMYFYGAQLEEGSYPTSYIPTNGSATTRSAETANGSGDASTFNDSEGVLMAEISALDNLGSFENLSLSDGNNLSRVFLFYRNSLNLMEFRVSVNNSIQMQFQYTIEDAKTFNKMLIKYKQNDFAVWINGFELHTDNSGITFGSYPLTNLSFDNGKVSSPTDPFKGKIKQLQYFQTALTDSELEQLTSWTSFTDMAQGQLYTIE